MSPEQFWAGRRVLVTGHTGFKGSWLSLLLQDWGAHVAGYALQPATEPCLFQVARVGARMLSVNGDVGHHSALLSLIREFQPEIIFHLAAQSLVRQSYAEPIETFATNVMGTVHVLEAARQAGCVRAIVNVTTDKCYENRETGRPYVESDPLGGRDPYSSSKACSELVTAAYQQSFAHGEGAAGIGIASARAGNVLGGGDWAKDRLVPDLLKALMDQRTAELRYPQSVRPWQHVLDPLYGYLLLAQGLLTQPAVFSRAWNFGPATHSAVTSGALADHLCHLWGPRAGWTIQPGAHPHEAQLLALDSSLAMQQMGWRPQLDWRDALAWVVDWHRAWQSGTDMRIFSLEQIRKYLNMTAQCQKGLHA